MDFVKKTVIAAMIATAPLIIGSIISLFTEQVVMARSIEQIEKTFLIYIKSIDNRLERIERYIDASDK